MDVLLPEDYAERDPKEGRYLASFHTPHFSASLWKQDKKEEAEAGDDDDEQLLQKDEEVPKRHFLDADDDREWCVKKGANDLEGW